ncbi:MAG: toxin-antitoxin system HicB family antitoxin [Thermodesulfobacteriota bacterium]|nr:toxin-antitoxin system HicB family antitoxin [Thermodesulfobacteriota bacterium]
MKKNRNVMTIRVPEDLKDRIEKFALLQGVSINQFALYTFTKELAELETNKFFRNELRSKKKDTLKKIDLVMSSIPARKNPEWDKIID